MRSPDFGWSYPAGCSGPPDYEQPTYPEIEQITRILEDFDLVDEVVEKVVALVESCAETAVNRYIEQRQADEQEAAAVLEMAAISREKLREFDEEPD